MESDNVEKLLKKYFEATTTTTEEEALKQYFSQDNVAEHLTQYAPMFHYFSKNKGERFTKQVPLTQKEKIFKRNSFKWASAVAVIMLLGIYIGKSYQDQRTFEKQQAEYAYYETKKALSLLAQNFNRGTEKVAYLKEFESTKQKIYKSK